MTQKKKRSGWRRREAHLRRNSMTRTSSPARERSAEILDDLPDVDVVIVPVGGRG
jgi:hypothetical protein